MRGAARRTSNDRQEHHPRHRAVGRRADWLAIFRRHAAAAGAASSSSSSRRPSMRPSSRARRRPLPRPRAPQLPGQSAQQAPGTTASRAEALKASPRVPIKTDSIEGSIALKGGRIDDVSLVKFHETVDPKSPPIVLLSPSGSPDPFYAEFGWTGAGGEKVEGAGRRHAVEAGRLRPPHRQPPGDARLGTMAKASRSAAPFRSTANICSPSKTRSSTKAASRSRSSPTG